MYYIYIYVIDIYYPTTNCQTTATNNNYPARLGTAKDAKVVPPAKSRPAANLEESLKSSLTMALQRRCWISSVFSMAFSMVFTSIC